ncbi:MAG: metallophosphatase family protein [Gammaproteobacteria bacterium]|nr:metallophosphatase family protein [Gammaproteobacteria bacterium]
MNISVKVGILSDTHGEVDQRIVDVISDCDFAIHAGDICGAHILESLKPRIDLIAVAGNNDHATLWHEDEAEIVSALPRSTQLSLPGGIIIIEHGHRLGNQPEHDQFRWDHAEAKLVVYGHTHKRIIDQSAEPWVVNPGAAGKVRNHGGPSCLILHASEAGWEIETIVFAETATVSNHKAA